MAMLVLHLRAARGKARAAAVAEALALLHDLAPSAPAGGPLSERGGVAWVELPERHLAAATARLPRLGYTTAVDLVAPAWAAARRRSPGGAAPGGWNGSTPRTPPAIGSGPRTGGSSCSRPAAGRSGRCAATAAGPGRLPGGACPCATPGCWSTWSPRPALGSCWTPSPGSAGSPWRPRRPAGRPSPPTPTRPCATGWAASAPPTWSPTPAACPCGPGPRRGRPPSRPMTAGPGRWPTRPWPSCTGCCAPAARRPAVRRLAGAGLRATGGLARAPGRAGQPGRPQGHRGGGLAWRKPAGPAGPVGVY